MIPVVHLRPGLNMDPQVECALDLDIDLDLYLEPADIDVGVQDVEAERRYRRHHRDLCPGRLLPPVPAPMVPRIWGGGGMRIQLL